MKREMFQKEIRYLYNILPLIFLFQYSDQWNNVFLIIIGILYRWYSARLLMGSRFIESAAYCNQILLAQSYKNSAQNTLVNWIIRLLLSLVCRPKVILLSGWHCISKYSLLFQENVQCFSKHLNLDPNFIFYEVSILINIMS